MLRRVVIATVGWWVLLATVAAVPAVAACPGWSVVASRNPQPNFNILNDVSALSATDAWAVGTTGRGSGARPLIEHWDGMTWSVVPAPTTSTSFLGLNGVVAISPTNVWAVGNKGSAGRPLILHYNGTKWSVAGAGTPGKGFANVGLDSITAIAPDDIWAVGTSVRSAQVWRPLAEHWDGQHWRVVTVPNPVTTINTLVDVSAVSTGDVWAVGWFGLANQTPLVEHWNGSRWSRVAGPAIASGGSLLSVQGLAASNVWAVGGTAQAVPRVLLEHWNGGAWSRSTGGDATAAGLSMYSTDGIWSVGARATATGTNTTASLLRTGSTWTRVAPISPGGNDLLNSVTEIPATTDAWAVGSTLKGGATRTLVERACR